jgi:hypothetical protein
MPKLYNRQNGKFFTDPIKAETITIAFLLCVRGLFDAGYTSMNFMDLIFNRRFKTTLRGADEPVMSFMWKRMQAAQENDVRMIFSIFDSGGWRFFGRV